MFSAGMRDEQQRVNASYRSVQCSRQVNLI
jgi:hypothetical protein